MPLRPLRCTTRSGDAWRLAETTLFRTVTVEPIYVRNPRFVLRRNRPGCEKHVVRVPASAPIMRRRACGPAGENHRDAENAPPDHTPSRMR